MESPGRGSLGHSQPNVPQPAEDKKILREVDFLRGLIRDHVSDFYNTDQPAPASTELFQFVPVGPQGLEAALYRYIAVQIISYIDDHRDMGKMNLLPYLIDSRSVFVLTMRGSRPYG
jgi:hypothetical protein